MASTRQRMWAASVAAILCLPLAALPLVDAWRGIRLAQAGPASPPDPPGDFRSLRLAGALALQNGQVPAAERLFRRALTLSPMDAETWRLLAAAFRSQGQASRQAALLRLAGSLTWRDPPTQRRLMLIAFQAGDLSAGVIHADALLRLTPNDPIGLAALLTAIDDPEGRTALARELAVVPAWRKLLFDNLLIGNDEDATGLVALLDRMRGTSAPPTPEENGLAIAKLIGAGYGPLALAYWRRVSGRPVDFDYLNNDPDFTDSLPALQAGLPGPPFGWSLAGGANIQVGGGHDAADRAALTFDGPPDGVSQVVTRSVLLAPGAYTLSFAGSADGQPTRRFIPRFTCATTGDTLPFDTLRPTEADGYLLGRVAVAIPATCTALRLGFGLSPSDDGQMHGFALRQVHWSRRGP